MMGMNRGSTRAGYWVLLVAMTIQGLTPDDGNLASSWLFRVVSAAPVDDTAAGGDPASIPTPLRDGDDDGVPGEICRAVAAASSLRGRLDGGGRLRIRFLPAGPLERPTRSAPRSLHPPGPGPRGPDGLIPSLCRFLC
jgi:hypothetical protein